MLFEQLHIHEPSMCQYFFLIYYIIQSTTEVLIPHMYMSCTEGKCFIFIFFYFKI